MWAWRIIDVTIWINKHKVLEEQFCWLHGWSSGGFSCEWLEKSVKDWGHGWVTPSVFYFPFDRFEFELNHSGSEESGSTIQGTKCAYRNKVEDLLSAGSSHPARKGVENLMRMETKKCAISLNVFHNPFNVGWSHFSDCLSGAVVRREENLRSPLSGSGVVHKEVQLFWP